MLKNKGKNEFLISIPIKELRDELDKGTTGAVYTYMDFFEGGELKDFFNQFKTGARKQGEVLENFVSDLSGYTLEFVKKTKRERIYKVKK